MKKVTVYVTETVRHKVSMELEDDAAKQLLKDLDSSIGDDHAGDLTNGRMTMQDGEYELDWYDVSGV